MKKNLKFSVIVNLNASGGKNLSLINEVIKLLKKDHKVKVFKTYNKDQAKMFTKEVSIALAAQYTKSHQGLFLSTEV